MFANFVVNSCQTQDNNSHQKETQLSVDIEVACGNLEVFLNELKALGRMGSELDNVVVSHWLGHSLVAILGQVVIMVSSQLTLELL